MSEWVGGWEGGREEGRERVEHRKLKYDFSYALISDVFPKW